MRDEIPLYILLFVVVVFVLPALARWRKSRR